MVDLFREILPSLNLKEEHLIDSGKMMENQFEPFIVNKAYSFGEDIILANMMNMSHHLPNKLQYDFYFYGLDKKKRFNKWIKKQSINSVDTIRKYCECSYKKAIQYSEILSSDQIEQIKEINSRMEDDISR